MKVRLFINDAEFEFSVQQLQLILAQALPEYCKHEDVAAPSEMAETVRQMVIGAASMFLDQFMTFVYGDRKPQIPIRADKLPWLTMGLIDLIIGTLLRYEVHIDAEEDSDRPGVFRVTGFTPKSVPALVPGAMGAEGECSPCAEQARARASAGSDGDAPTGLARTIESAKAE